MSACHNSTMKLRIREYRKAAGLSQEKLGFAVGVDQSAISHYEKGRNLPRLETLELIAAALGVPTPELIADDESADDASAALIVEAYRRMSPEDRRAALTVLLRMAAPAP